MPLHNAASHTHGGHIRRVARLDETPAYWRSLSASVRLGAKSYPRCARYCGRRDQALGVVGLDRVHPRRDGRARAPAQEKPTGQITW